MPGHNGLNDLGFVQFNIVSRFFSLLSSDEQMLFRCMPVSNHMHLTCLHVLMHTSLCLDSSGENGHSNVIGTYSVIQNIMATMSHLPPTIIHHPEDLMYMGCSRLCPWWQMSGKKNRVCWISHQCACGKLLYVYGQLPPATFNLNTLTLKRARINWMGQQSIGDKTIDFNTPNPLGLGNKSWHWCLAGSLSPTPYRKK